MFFVAPMLPADPTLALTQKGYGYIEGASDTANLALSYANVSSGSAPSAGDLVAWIVFAGDLSAQPINDLTGSGWAQSRTSDLGYFTSILAKVVVSGDISSPPTIVTGPQLGSAAMWVAFTVAGDVGTLAVAGLARSPSVGNPDPEDIAVNSTALSTSQYAITMSLGTGDDGAISLAWTGATPDIQFQRTNVFSTTGDVEYAVHLIAGGESITVSKGDDGGLNCLAAGYVSVSP